MDTAVTLVQMPSGTPTPYLLVCESDPASVLSIREHIPIWWVAGLRVNADVTQGKAQRHVLLQWRCGNERL
jgi:hypothetical protein